ncbi:MULTISPECIES: chaplin [unclassified Streptomyces]|uniref:chaplin n=1 Tax=unclassified Streptomyces TaxID=2593676 RepID=UPI0034453394
MRIRVLAATGALATALVLGGSTAAFAGGGDGGATANGFAAGSPGILSGNVVQIPIDIPINVCGNSIGVVSLLSPTVGNHCVNK